MTVISVPFRLKLAASALFLCIPLIALEVVIANRASWWNLPYRSLGYWSLAFGLICVPLITWITSARKWAFFLTGLLVGLWIVASTWVSIRMRYPPLGFFTLFLLGYFVLELIWLKYELGRSFFDPQMAWYQGLPKSVPGLSCRAKSAHAEAELRVSRLDSEGAFVFVQGIQKNSVSTLTRIFNDKRVELTFSFRDQKVTCNGKPTLAIYQGLGVGFQFVEVSPDLRKEVGDFVEVLKGEGYV